jgi:hypothetical protein
MYEAAFRNIDDTPWKDAGCSSELDYIEQASWVLFLKYLDNYFLIASYVLTLSVLSPENTITQRIPMLVPALDDEIA